MTDLASLWNFHESEILKGSQRPGKNLSGKNKAGKNQTSD